MSRTGMSRAALAAFESELICRRDEEASLVICPLEGFLPFPCNRCANGERHLKFNDMISK